MKLRKGTSNQFKRHVPGVWMIDRAAFRGKIKLFAFFTCPLPACNGAINKAHITTFYEKKFGTFDCIYCKRCRLNMSLQFLGFGDAYAKEVKKLKTKQKPFTASVGV